MKPYRRMILAVVGLILVSLSAVHAAEFPNKPIRWIIPFPPGGSNDVLGRYIGIKLSKRIGQQIVIDNRGGANGIIGAHLAAQSPADGDTLLMVSTSAVPDVPTVIESGFPGYEVYVSWGAVVPAGVPRARAEKLRREIVAVLQDPDTRKWLAANAAAETQIMAPAEIRKMVHDDIKKWTDVAKTAGIKVK
ncbi:MAG: tripartite tricarboxylate transporter substrate-binding protein [Betaproteobacteria bacterium]|nr:tripartite tricarboxylate transporter substrate-binding protein [Betaproteobacteria bacterium]MDH3437031.1 tripartite tricarboxylate transporter substrate-binding protein [Betaproteobacteria bacterium]